MFGKEFIDGAAYNYKAAERCYIHAVLNKCQINIKPGVGVRWSKPYLGNSASKEHMGCSLVWKMQMVRKMNSIITASQMNKNARAHCEKYFMELKELMEFDMKKGRDLNSLPNVLNPHGSLQKGAKNKRFNSIIEKKCDQVKRRKTKKLPKIDITLPTFNLSSSRSHVQHLMGENEIQTKCDTNTLVCLKRGIKSNTYVYGCNSSSGRKV
ncbi:hypothetical protein Cgig2_002680 [Carnegiea gigantea]|uniref:Uncharacterized protein n=1 Tax=Carnegiea gigantea TaxID=171969 RepID=A0A9Q1K3F6_9CARY|nr:hypothetical protein Cgig2_002680 [Carnegiea gigantea]